MKSISDIKHAFYINLESRTDRKTHVERQLHNIGITATRFNALKLLNGRIGCSLSHLKCLELAKQNNWEHILIVEDDITFLNPDVFITQINKFLNNHSSFDVLLFAGNNVPPYNTIGDYCIKVTHCQTTTGYLVMNHYYDTLIENIKQGVQLLITKPSQHITYAVDKWWLQLQKVDNWFLITPLTVIQREDYSDIEKRHTNYTNLMIDLNKIQYQNKTKLNNILFI